MIYELVAYNTDSRYPNDVRYRKYTTSKKLAEYFNKIPKIQFTDSGHGIVFTSHEHKGHKLPECTELFQYVYTELKKININKLKLIKPPKFNIYKLGYEEGILEERRRIIEYMNNNFSTLPIGWETNLP